MLPGINNIVKSRESSQTMKHTMSVVLSLKTFSIKLRGLRVWKAYDVGPGKCFTPTHDEWIWKTSRAYRPMRRAALNCTARETATLRSRNLTSVSSNLLKKSTKFSNLRECISPTLRRDTQRTSYESFAVCINTWMRINTLSG